MGKATDYGERKHETCKFGTLNPAFTFQPPIDDEPIDARPALMPICNWQPQSPCPPAVTRSWGGAVEYDRDCAVCLAHKPVEL